MVSKPRRRPSRPVYFETTIPVIRTCRLCGSWLAAGVAEGMKAEVDLHVLEGPQIVLAMLMKTEVYVLRRTGLIHMDPIRLSGKFLGRLYPQHRCDVKWPLVSRSEFDPPDSGVVPY